jgi:Protein of unknown function (DUF2948)
VLHLTAFDEQDLAAISAQMQDAVITLGNIKFDRRRKQLALVANRYAWDATWDQNPQKQRRRTGLRINYVQSAKRLFVAAVNQGTIFNLLALTFESPGIKDDPSGHIILHFSGGHKISMEVECIDIQLDDLGPAWGTANEPQHET